MAIYLWDDKAHMKKMPPAKLITKMGIRGWDFGIDYQTPSDEPVVNSRATFTMPGFGRQGRWGNMVFQYLFIRILALNNNRDIEMYRSSDSINNRMCMYKDMQDIPTIQTKSQALIIMDYQFQLGYIPQNLWRAIYVCTVRLMKCYFLHNIHAAITQPLPFIEQDATIELEGAFLLKSYNQQNKEYILTQLFQTNEEFGNFIDTCLQKLGTGKTIIGIHIRRGDTAKNPLGQQFDLPVPIIHFIEWLQTNIPLINNPVIYVASDDPDVYKEINIDGVDVFYKKKVLPDDELCAKYEKYEQIDWEIMRRCDILLTSNSTFSFSAALLSTKQPVSYRFSVNKKAFEQFEPWDTDPLEMYAFSKYVWTTLYERFTLVRKNVSAKRACYRVAKDVIYWMYWKKTKIKYLYYLHGFSFAYFSQIFNIFELFQVPKNNRK